MASIFLDSTAGGAGTGADWTNAYTTMAALITGGITNADVVYMSNSHAESTAGAVTLAMPTSIGCQVLCVTPSGASGNSGLATTGSIAVGAAASALTVRGFAYWYGVSFLGGTTSSAAATITLCENATAGGMIFDNCKFELRNVNSPFYLIGGAPQGGLDDSYIEYNDCTFKFGATTQGIRPQSARIVFRNCSLDSAGSTPATLFIGLAGSSAQVLIEACDWSGEVFTNLVSVGLANYSTYTFRNCKMPAFTNVTTGTNPNIGGTKVYMHDCDSADTHIRFAEHSWHGSVVNQITTLIRTGGAQQADGTSYSWLMNGSANSVNIYAPLASPEWVVYNTAVGSAKTVTVEILRDNATNLQDDEIWLEVQYLGTSGFPKGTIITDRMANILSTPADQATSAASWDTTGMSAANEQKLEVTFTPQEAGYLICRVMLAANTSVYVDPVATIS